MKEWDLCKCFCTFHTVLFKQKLLQLVLWNKHAPLKEQGHNGFPQINIPFNFSQINHRLLVIMDRCSKCCKISTVSFTCGLSQVFPCNNETVIEKMHVWKCHHITWNLGGIIFSISISVLQFLPWQNTKVIHWKDGCNWTCELTLSKKGQLQVLV